MFFSFNKKLSKNKSSKLKILSGYNFRFRKIGKKSEESIIKYSNHFGFDYEINKSNTFERPFNWLKIKMIIENLEKGSHDFFMWLDADAMFCKYENILDHIDSRKHLFVHNSFFKSVHKTKYKFVNYLTWAPNDGVILVRNTKWSLSFFKNVWNKKKYLNHFWTDNAAFMDEMGFKAEIAKISDNKVLKNTLDKTFFLPGIWNSMPGKNYKKPENDKISNFYFDPVIIHLAGIRRRDRLKFLKEYKNIFI